MTGPGLTAADVRYVRLGYRSLDEVCVGRQETPEHVRALIAAGLLPAPSYVLPDGTEMVPGDYFVLPDQAGGPAHLREEFERRHAAAGGEASELEEDWAGYIGGIYGVCLREALPETIVRKTELVRSIGELLSQPAPADGMWGARLRAEVRELDALERDFSPDYDRNGRFEEPPSRDRLIASAHERYPELFAAEVAHGG